MIHGDLKGVRFSTASLHPVTNLILIKANVMIDQNGHARLADFGLLTFVSDPSNPTNSSSIMNSGTTRWMSPELLHPEEFNFEKSRPTKKSDCYALGMVILEVLSEEPPFARDKEFIVMLKVIRGERPERPEGVCFTDDLWRTLEECWLLQPKDRPTLEAVLECLGLISKIWEPPSPILGNVETDVDEWVSTTSQGMLLRFVPNS
jgi:serine/threonine protein kinase